MQQYPKHVAIIMDGNGRWAKNQGLPRTAGHHRGSENVKEIAIHANKLGIKVLTLYAFSTENWSRPNDEVKYLMQLPAIFFKKFLKDLMRNNVRIETIGELDAFPSETKRILQSAIDETSKNTGLILNFAMNYGSRREIILATKKIAEKVMHGLEIDEISEKLFDMQLMTSHLTPVDFLIRTSGECRLSNFLLWQLAYAEMHFMDVSWPDFSPREFDKALEVYQGRHRRFGGV